MTVLHYVDRWLPLSERFVYDLVRHSRHDSLVVSRARPVNVAAFPVPRVRSLHRWTWLPSRGVERVLGRVARRAGAGVLHAHFGYRAGEAAGAAYGVPAALVVSLWGHDVTEYPRSRPDVYTGVFERAAAVVVPSRYLADRVIELGGDPDRVRVIPTGIDVAAFPATPLPAGPPTLLFVGRLVAKKGLDVLAEAWPAVTAAVPEARLRIVGFGPLESEVRSWLPTAQLDPPDPVDPAGQVRAAMAAATAVVTPSRTARDGDAESLLYVNLEAQASGRPVVTTRHGGIPEFVEDGRSALVVPEADAEALAAALVAVLGDRELAARLGSAGPAVAGRFDAASCAAQVDALYDEVLG